MTRMTKGLIVAVLHLGLVASLGGKLLYDRTTLPRVWAQAAPYDPDLPIRGRYVRLQLAVEPRGLKEPAPAARWQPTQGVVLGVESGRLVATSMPPRRAATGDALTVRFVERQGEKLAVLSEPVAFFIPEHVADPSRRAADETLWAEVTVPRKGPPRPIRLGVRKGNGGILPLQLD